VVVVTHRPEPEGWDPEAPFHFVDGVEAAVAKAQELAGDRMVEVAAGEVGGQVLAAGLPALWCVARLAARNRAGTSGLVIQARYVQHGNASHNAAIAIPGLYRCAHRAATKDHHVSSERATSQCPSGAPVAP